jgi:hypothetical protein
MKIAMVQKLLPGSGEAARIMPAHNSGKRLLPIDGQPLKPFQKGCLDFEFCLRHA